ncbi:membrane protein [Mycobacterium phage Fefferhead]|nr:membrane protein [Mycobacterium phage Fefferhead]
MSPAPYCLPCNRHHDGDCNRAPGDTGLAILGWFLLLVASVLIGLAFAGASVGVWSL